MCATWERRRARGRASSQTSRQRPGHVATLASFLGPRPLRCRTGPPTGTSGRRVTEEAGGRPVPTPRSGCPGCALPACRPELLPLPGGNFPAALSATTCPSAVPAAPSSRGNANDTDGFESRTTPSGHPWPFPKSERSRGEMWPSPHSPPLRPGARSSRTASGPRGGPGRGISRMARAFLSPCPQSLGRSHVHALPPDENLHRSLSASAAPQLGVRHAPCSACPFAARPSPSVSPLRPSPAPHLLFISDLCRVRCESASFLLRGSGGCPPPAGHMRTAQCGLHSPGYFSLPCTPRNPTCPGVQACQREDNLKSNDKYNLGVQSGCNLTFN